jgi:O-antigen/teichoic acid export membrane protein
VSRFGQNVVANLLGSGWTTAVQLAVVPALISLMGVASFALLGFYATLMAMLTILDLGLSPTLMRKMAGIRAYSAESSFAAPTLRTYELFYVATGVALGGCIAAAAPLIARAWLSSSTLDTVRIADSVRIMGLLVALRWPLAPYVATLQGLQKQVGLNVLNAVAVTAANVAGLALVAFVSPAIELFFAWQCACAAGQLAALRAMAWRALPRDAGPRRLMRRTLLDNWRFASGMTGISVATVILTQGDKIILSKLVSLEEFGYYSVALTVAAAVYIILIPLFSATLPRLSQLVAAGDEPALQRAFADASSLMNAALVPVAVFLMLYSNEVLLLWTGNHVIAERSAPLLSLLALGALCNGFMNIPFALQLARGNASLGLAISSALCLLLVPAIVLLTGRYGVVGGAAVSPLLNGLYLAVGLPLTYRLCLGSGRWLRFYGGVLREQGPALIVLVMLRYAVSAADGQFERALVLTVGFAASLAASILGSPEARKLLLTYFPRRAS